VGHQLHPLEGEAVEQAGDVGEVAAKPVQRFDHHHLEPA
jgi:hypothetical protein